MLVYWGQDSSTFMHFIEYPLLTQSHFDLAHKFIQSLEYYDK